MQIILKYFPRLSEKQKLQFSALKELYEEWNKKINLISRKDIASLYEKHILHSLAIAKFISFKPGTKILDVGTGGGFPGIPLAILFPDSEFTLCDSIGKKVHVAENISETIGLMNTDFVVGRAERLREPSDFIVSRAVAPIEQLYRWTHKLLSEDNHNEKMNGFILLKGGNLDDEIKALKQLNGRLRIETSGLDKYFDEPFFETKKLVYITR